jgi:hypothetical protein
MTHHFKRGFGFSALPITPALVSQSGGQQRDWSTAARIHSRPSPHLTDSSSILPRPPQPQQNYDWMNRIYRMDSVCGREAMPSFQLNPVNSAILPSRSILSKIKAWMIRIVANVNDPNRQ